MGELNELILIGVFAFSCAVVVVHELGDLIVGAVMRRLPR